MTSGCSRPRLEQADLYFRRVHRHQTLDIIVEDFQIIRGLAWKGLAIFRDFHRQFFPVLIEKLNLKFQGCIDEDSDRYKWGLDMIAARWHHKLTARRAAVAGMRDITQKYSTVLTYGSKSIFPQSFVLHSSRTIFHRTFFKGFDHVTIACTSPCFHLVSC